MKKLALGSAESSSITLQTGGKRLKPGGGICGFEMWKINCRGNNERIKHKLKIK